VETIFSVAMWGLINNHPETKPVNSLVIITAIWVVAVHLPGVGCIAGQV
jgi:hypothetical protein